MIRPSGYLLILLFSAVSLVAIISATGCANIVPPAGGDRDSLPPVMVRAEPESETLNFKEKRFSFSFDEYVEVQNAAQNLIISPVPKTMPEVKAKLRTVTVRLRDSLQPNTTYSFNFTNVIKDVNEGNQVKDFFYVFSTGNTIDSLEMTGNVILAENAQIDTTLTVMLHNALDDSSVYKVKPRYISKLDSKGNYHFRYLSPGTYRLYALKDESGSYRYLNKKTLFAFHDTTIVIGEENEPVTLYAYNYPEDASTLRTTAPKRDPKDRRLKFQTGSSTQDLKSPYTFTFETPLKTFDSSKVLFSRDSTLIPITSGFTWKQDSTRKKLMFNYAWQEGVEYNFILEKDFATDTLGFQLLKQDTIEFAARKASEYGTLKLRFRNLDLTQKPVLQFIQNGEVKFSFPLTSNQFNQSLFEPGEYDLRVLRDENGNGIWDPGVFFTTHRQPERVMKINRKISVRPNWENEIEIDITAPAAAPRAAGAVPARR